MEKSQFKSKFLVYFLTFLAFLLFDFAWIIFGANPIYQEQVGDLLIDTFRIVPAFITYFALVFGLFIFAINPSHKERKFFKALVLGSLFGLLTYVVFAFTNFSIIEGWTLKLALIDSVWGAVIGAIVSGIGFRLSIAFLE